MVLLVALAAVITALFPPAELQRVARFAVGEVADEPVIARVDFEVPKSAEDLERERRDAASTVPPTLDFQPDAAETMAGRLESFFAGVDTLRMLPETGPLLAFLDEHSLQPTVAQFQLLRNPETLEALRGAAIRAAREILPTGVADQAVLDSVTTPTIVVQEPTGEVRSVGREAVLSRNDFVNQGLELLPLDAPPELDQILRLVLIQNMEYSFALNVPATSLNRDAAARAVPTVLRDVRAGEAIVRANEQITPAAAETLEAYTDALEREGLLEEGGTDITPFVGSGLLNVMLLSSFGLFLLFYRPQVYTSFRWLLLVVALVFSYFGLGALIARNELPPELLPVAFVALSAGVLWDGRMALVLAALLAVLTGVQQPFASAGVVATTFLGGAAAALSARAVRRRAQTWVFIAIITAAYTLGLLALALMQGWEPTTLGWALLAAAGNATLSAILAMGFVPVFELFTGITTDQTLLEWADPNRSLLKRLSMEAPGTYAHTINVANLAEAAANAIGAHGLLCRVGLYYHDVGKMQRPQYFVENQSERINPHDRLRPDTSAAIVKEHVVEGLRLAREAKVPEVVAAFIPEHHGTQRISFFWEKAKEQFGEADLNVDDYTYPGPKPQSRETAVAMLADSVESAMRALQDPTPERVRDLIENIVQSKIDAGQLDESPLTLREIRQIKEQFVKVLSGIHHHRIDYPQTRHLTEARDGRGAKAAGNGQKAPPPAGPAPEEVEVASDADEEEEEPAQEEEAAARDEAL